MSRDGRPWMKFHPADHRADPGLRMCSLAARGLWVELLGYAHEAEPYGHLLVAGKAPTTAQLAALVGSTPREVERLLAELEAADVFSRAPDGVIFSRRMVRDHQRAEEGRQAVGRRWSKSPPSTDPIGDPNRGAITQSQKPEIPSRSPSERERARAGRGTRLPEGWSPGFDSLAFAVGVGLSREEHDEELDRFRDHWRSEGGAKGVKRDWDAAVRNWLRRAVEYRGGGRAKTSPGAARGQSALATFLEGAAAAFPHDEQERPARPGNGHAS